MPNHLLQRIAATTVIPAVSPPSSQKRDVGDADDDHGILPQTWSPIGDITFYRSGEHDSTRPGPHHHRHRRHPGKMTARVMLRWHLQPGRSAIPKFANLARIAENFDLSDSSSPDEVTSIDDSTPASGRPRTRRYRSRRLRRRDPRVLTLPGTTSVLGGLGSLGWPSDRTVPSFSYAEVDLERDDQLRADRQFSAPGSRLIRAP
jgi:hypothetical protein